MEKWKNLINTNTGCLNTELRSALADDRRLKDRLNELGRKQIKI